MEILSHSKILGIGLAISCFSNHAMASAECDALAKSPNTAATICKMVERGMVQEAEARIQEKPELLLTDCTRLGDLGHSYRSHDDLFS